MPRPAWKVFHRLLGELSQARIDAPRLGAGLRALRGRRAQYMDPLSRLPPRLAPMVRKVTLNGVARKRQYEMRESLYAPPPFRGTWRVRVPPAGRLDFFSAAWGRITFAVEVGPPGRPPRRVFTFHSPRPSPDAPWRSHRVDLKALAGQEVDLHLVTEGRGGHAFFGTPRILGRAPDAPPSVLLITIDTLSADPIGFCGSDRRLSPNMDRFAATGVAFPRAYTNANWTRPSTLNMFFSEFTTNLGINAHSWWLDKRKRRRLYQIFDGQLPELMKRAGYLSAAVGNNLFLLGYHFAGVEMGFEEVSDFRTDHRDTPDITAAAQAFLRRHKDEPFFYFVNYNTPHHPYSPPRRYLSRVDRPGERLHPQLRRYLGEVAFVDDHIGKLLETVDRLGLRHRTLILLTADHGEGLRGDNNYIVTAIPRFSRFTHTVNLYEEVVRVPLAISRPADLPAGRKVMRQVRMIDIAPTLLSLVGLPPHPQHRGVDISGLLRGETPAGEALPVFTEGKKCGMVRYRGYKYIHRQPGYDMLKRKQEGYRLRRVPEELYHVAEDPRELRDLVHKRPPILAELRRMYRQWRAQLREGVLPRGEWAPGNRAGPVVARPARDRGVPTREHLLVSGDGKTRLVEGSIFVRGRIRSFRMSRTETNDAIWPARADRLDFSFSVHGDQDRLSLETDPPGADLTLKIRVDGRPLAAGELLLGPYGLPLLKPPFHLRGAEVGGALAAQGPPFLHKGARFGVFLWRQGAAATGPQPDTGAQPVETGDAEGLDPEVEKALRGWGYIQAGDKKKKLK